MAVPYYKAIPGNFVIIGKEPDGDSVRFIADEFDLFEDIYRSYRLKPSRTDNSVQLRFEAVDTPELHYGKDAQPLGDTARDAMLKQLGFSGIKYNGDVVSDSKPDRLHGVILSKGVDTNGRPIVYVLNQADADDLNLSEWNLVDEKLLEKTINKYLLEQGIAYYTVYTSTPSSHRNFLRNITKKARSEKRGVWKIDDTNNFILETQEDIGANGSLVLPKLFRRCTDYLKAEAKGFNGELTDWLNANSSGSRRENDLVLLESSGIEVPFSSLIKQLNRRISLTADLLDLTFLEK
jgi:endonuclease YncB( thermonuclease family)